MRHAIAGLIGLACLWGVAQAQTAATKPYPSRVSAAAPIDSLEPNRLYYLGSAQLIRVELTPVEFGGGGALKAKFWIDLPGASSELVIAEAQPRFRVVADRAAVLTARLGALEAKDGKRRGDVQPEKADLFKKKIPLVLEKVQDGVYELRPEKPLEPGEYAIATAVGTPVADFTIQAAPKDSNKP